MAADATSRLGSRAAVASYLAAGSLLHWLPTHHGHRSSASPYILLLQPRLKCRERARARERERMDPIPRRRRIQFLCWVAVIWMQIGLSFVMYRDVVWIRAKNRIWLKCKMYETWILKIDSLRLVLDEILIASLKLEREDGHFYWLGFAETKAQKWLNWDAIWHIKKYFSHDYQFI